MRYRATHITRYSYSGAVATCHNQVRLTPRQTARQRVLSTVLHIDPDTSNPETFRDYFGNVVQNFEVLQAHSQLTLSAMSLVEVDPASPPEPSWTDSWESVRQSIALCDDRPALEAYEFTAPSPLAPISGEFAAFAAPDFPAGRPVLEAVVALCARIHGEFAYMPLSTTVDTAVADVFRTRCGVCQDFAHVAIAALRSLGLAARYVSGYLRSGAEYTGAEASHAWFSVWVPPYGWIDADPTNNVLPSDGHVTLAWGRDYSDVAPVKGVTLGGGEHQVSVEVRVEPTADEA